MTCRLGGPLPRWSAATTGQRRPRLCIPINLLIDIAIGVDDMSVSECLPGLQGLQELKGWLPQLPELALPSVHLPAMSQQLSRLSQQLKARLPDLEADQRRAAAAAAAAALVGAGLLVLVVRRRRRQRKAAEAAAAAAEDSPIALGACGVLLEPLEKAPAAPKPEAVPARPAGDVTTLAELEALPTFRLFAAPVMSVRVTHQGAALAELHASLFALKELRELDLAGNALPVVPSAIGNLAALTRCAGIAATPACLLWVASCDEERCVPVLAQQCAARLSEPACACATPVPPQAVPGWQPAEGAAPGDWQAAGGW